MLGCFSLALIVTAGQFVRRAADAARCDSPAKLTQLGRARLSNHLRKNKIRHQLRTIDKVLAWAAQAADAPIQDVLEQQARRRRGPEPIGDLLPAVLARLNVRTKEANRNRDRS